VLEVGQSVQIIERCLENIPEGEIVAEPNPNKLLMKIRKVEGEGIGRHEAPRGEVFHYVKFKAGSEAPVAWKIKAPTYSNLMSWIPMLQGGQIADIPIVAASIDPCVACRESLLYCPGCNPISAASTITTNSGLWRLTTCVKFPGAVPQFNTNQSSSKRLSAT